MGEGDARARVGVIGLRERLADVVWFIKRPTFVARPMPWGRDAGRALATVFAFGIALDWLVGFGIVWWDASAGFLPKPVKRYDNPGELAFKVLLFAPVVEEALFRGWLSGRVAALRFAAFGFAAHGLFLASLWAGEAWEMPLALGGVVLIFVGLVQWLTRRGRETHVPGWFQQHFHWLVWGSSLFFALIHLGNYALFEDPRGVLVVASQLIGGLMLAYVRTRLGLGAAIFYHAAYNGLILLGLSVG